MSSVRLLATLLAIGLPLHALAADPRAPDWPCVQARVPELSVAAVWGGPPIDDALATWKDDPATADLVARLAARRVPLEEAEEAARQFVRIDAQGRERRAKALVAGLFETLNRERLEIVAGLERLTRRQRAFVQTIEADVARLRDLQGAADAPQGEVAALATKVEWGTRIFEERRKVVRFACEVPVLIEQRFFALARAAEQALD